MGTRSFCLGLVLTAVMGLAPEAARCQDYSPPDPEFPLPLYHERPETGGFYAAGEFLLFRQTDPIKLRETLQQTLNETYSRSATAEEVVKKDKKRIDSTVDLADKWAKLPEAE